MGELPGRLYTPHGSPVELGDGAFSCKISYSRPRGTPGVWGCMSVCRHLRPCLQIAGTFDWGPTLRQPSSF